jgi:hypothetical protein
MTPNKDNEISAEYQGTLKLGEYELPCYVLSNRKRVLIMREVVHLLTGNRKGGLDRYTKASGVRDYMPEKYVIYPHKEVAILFRVGNKLTYGYEAEDVIAICDAYLKAREKNALHPTQEHLAQQAEIFIRACAKVGLVALIDEATGFQAVRDDNELQVKLAAYISKEMNEWVKTFPVDFFNQLYRLEGHKPPLAATPYPMRFGKYVMQFVYDTLDPDVADWLRANNPNPEGQRHHHQWLSKEYGQQKLQRHLMEVLGIMKASPSMDAFKDNIARAFADAHERRRVRLEQMRREKAIQRRKKRDEVTGQLGLDLKYF